MEKYLISLNKNEMFNMLKFRTGNHFFTIKPGRWGGIEHSKRRCRLWNKHSEVGDGHFTASRRRYVNKYLYQRPNLLNLNNWYLLNQLTYSTISTDLVQQCLMLYKGNYDNHIVLLLWSYINSAILFY